MYDINIKKVNRGFTVKVGCQTIVFEKEKDLFSAISDYFKDPEKAKEKYITEKSSILDMPVQAEDPDQIRCYHHAGFTSGT